ncbi:MAG TPA: heme o synthase [Candidatus Paceibacterota bacterium]|jgi:protoheme IX farnesyltransferase|nr:heme o synthase [Candidatus Paceibacterota bacterium]
MIRDYYELIKPGIIYGNAITAAAGFFLAAQGNFNLSLFIAMLLGLSCVIGSACAFNNLIEIDIDAKMERTKNRALVAGRLDRRDAFWFALALGVCGLSIFAAYVDLLALAVVFLGAVAYLALYTPMKRMNLWSTAAGSISGAVPPVVGYVAVANRLDWAAAILFIILVLWQIPHFYAIGIYRGDEYGAASLPILPVVKGMRAAKVHIALYVAAFTLATLSLWYFGYAGAAYAAAAGLASLAWLAFAMLGFRKGNNDKPWARKFFLVSLAVLLVISIAISCSGIFA